MKVENLITKRTSGFFDTFCNPKPFKYVMDPSQCKSLSKMHVATILFNVVNLGSLTVEIKFIGGYGISMKSPSY